MIKDGKVFLSALQAAKREWNSFNNDKWLLNDKNFRVIFPFFPSSEQKKANYLLQWSRP